MPKWGSPRGDDAGHMMSPSIHTQQHTPSKAATLEPHVTATDPNDNFFGNQRVVSDRLHILQANVLKMHKAIRKSGKPNFMGCKLPVHSNINVAFLQSEAADYEDSAVLNFLRYGFPANYAGSSFTNAKTTNHKGATDFPQTIGEYLHKEKLNGAIIGPFSSNPFSCFFSSSPLNTVPKRDSEERRVILDLSFPPVGSVNSGIPRDSYLGDTVKLTLPTVNTIVAMIKVKGRGCALFKRDLRRAYRQIPVDVGDIHMLGYTWKDHLYFDMVLPMGLRSSALCCQRTTNLVAHICQKRSISVINYLDDFIGVEFWARASEAYMGLGTILKDSGLEESAPKAISPTFTMPCLGVQFDTMALTLTITPDRLQEILELLDTWENKTRANKQEVQSLLGKLMFVASCVRPGRVFVSRLLNFLRCMPNDKFMTLSYETLADIRWWKVFMPLYNGVSMMPWQEWSEPDEVVSSDACPSGCGAWVDDEFFSRPFPSHILALNLHINALELLTVVVSIKVWGKRWMGKRIVIYCDNMTSVTVVNSGASRDPFLQQCLREICFWAARYEFELKATHLPGMENRTADILSRAHLGDLHACRLTQLCEGWQARNLPVSDELFNFSHRW